MDQQQSSLSSQEWPSLSPSPNVESEKLVKNKKCDECPFVTHKTYNLKNHKKIHVKVTQQPMEILKCEECDKTFTKKKALSDHRSTSEKSTLQSHFLQLFKSGFT